MGSDRGTLYVLDGTAALFRAHFGMSRVAGKDGMEVGALLGLGQWAVKFLRDVRPRYVAAVFDAGATTFRNEIHAAYKAHRPPPPPELVPQFAWAGPVLEALGIAGFRVPGYEADDIMATMVRRAKAAGLGVAMVTPDKDVLQLVDEDVVAIDPKTFATIDARAVLEKFGVPPSLLADLQALAGDPTDNVPGVDGIGLKTAAAILTGLGNLDQALADPERAAALVIRGAKTLPAKLRAGKDAALLSRRLVVLCDTVPLRDESMSLRTLRWKGPAADAQKTFDALGFHEPLRAVGRIAVPPQG